MLSITNTSKLLHISKFKLLKLLEQEDIVPTRSGNKKLLTEEQIQQLQSLLNQSKEHINLFNKLDEQEQKDSSTSVKQDFMYEKIVDEKEAQIQYLRQQLEQEKQDRREIEKGILGVQAQLFKFQNILEAPEVKKSILQRIFSKG